MLPYMAVIAFGQRPGEPAMTFGHSFTPSVQLARQAGCQHTYDPSPKVYLPVRDESLQTAVPGSCVAGDGAGKGGKDVAQ